MCPSLGVSGALVSVKADLTGVLYHFGIKMSSGGICRYGNGRAVGGAGPYAKVKEYGDPTAPDAPNINTRKIWVPYLAGAVLLKQATKNVCAYMECVVVFAIAVFITTGITAGGFAGRETAGNQKYQGKSQNNKCDFGYFHLRFTCCYSIKVSEIQGDNTASNTPIAEDQKPIPR